MTTKRTATKTATRPLDVQLFPGERVEIDDTPIVPTAQSDEDLVKRYAAGETRIVTEHARYPLQAIPGMLRDKTRYKLDPSYQRRRRWTEGKSSRLIESFIMNVPVPPVFLYEYDLARYEVLDGQQRLSTINDFYNDAFSLSGLEYWPELNGRKYNTLPPYIRDGIDRGYLSSIVLLKLAGKSQQEEARLKQFVFQRINSGGVRLEAQEQRNALFPGPFNDMCKDLARNDDFRAMWLVVDGEEPAAEDDGSMSEPDKFQSTMMDVELVLRFFAYRQVHTAGKRDPAWDEYLDAYLQRGNEFSVDVRKNLEQLFVDTVSFIHEALGNNAFCAWRSTRWYRRPQKGIYDAVMYGFSAYLPHRTKIVQQKSAVVTAFTKMHVENQDAFRGRATNRIHMRERNRIVLKILAKFV